MSWPRPGQPKILPLRFEENVSLNLRVYCEVTDAVCTRVVNRATEEWVQRELKANKGLRRRFETRMAEILEEDKVSQFSAGASRLRAVPSKAPVEGSSHEEPQDKGD